MISEILPAFSHTSIVPILRGRYYLSSGPKVETETQKHLFWERLTSDSSEEKTGNPFPLHSTEHEWDAGGYGETQKGKAVCSCEAPGMQEG